LRAFDRKTSVGMTDDSLRGDMKKLGAARARKRKRVPGALAHLDWWRKSPEFREIMRQAGLRATARWNAMPRCGARKRSDGEPCKNPGIEPSGRCRFHGGKTPRGKEWHRIQASAGKSDAHAEQVAFKLKQKDRAAQARARRLARMTPDEQAAHRAWHAAHRPGPPEARAGARERKRQDREAAELFARPSTNAPNPEAEAIQRQIDELQRQADELRANPATWTEGIFS
jgi:hypothetical protein